MEMKNYADTFKGFQRCQYGHIYAWEPTPTGAVSRTILDGRYSKATREEMNIICASVEMLDALKQAELAVSELCQGQDPANQCWQTLREVRAAIDHAEGRWA
jgi:hypothetical protein